MEAGGLLEDCRQLLIAQQHERNVLDCGTVSLSMSKSGGVTPPKAVQVHWKRLLQGESVQVYES